MINYSVACDLLMSKDYEFSERGKEVADINNVS
jgi:hypothetical protein